MSKIKSKSQKQKIKLRDIKLAANPIVPKKRELRMIWNYNGVFVPSGYGVEMKDLLYRLLADGWPIAHIAFTGLEGGLMGVNGLTVYPKMGDQWGADAMVFHGKHFRADATFCMQDVWTLNPEYLKQIPYWIPWVPIDQEPVPENVLNALKYAYKIVTFSKFGHDALEKAGLTSTLIIEGTDVEIMKPMNKNECKAMLGFKPEQYIVGMVGANKENPPRKGWQQALEGFKLFHDKHPEAIFFYQTNQQHGGGFPIRHFAKTLGIGDAIFSMDEYMATYHSGADVMAKLYNAFDVLLHPSLSEGFGLCAVEAQSCGTPVIVNNTCSMPELVIPGVTGEICDAGEKFFTNALGYFTWPSVPSIADKLEKIYNADRVEMGKRAREHSINNFNIDKIVKEQWTPFLEELQEDILSKPRPVINALDTIPVVGQIAAKALGPVPGSA